MARLIGRGCQVGGGVDSPRVMVELGARALVWGSDWEKGACVVETEEGGMACGEGAWYCGCCMCMVAVLHAH